MAVKQQISASMTIGDIFSKFPHKSQRLAQAMTNAGLHCSSCSAATWETLEAGILSHGFSVSALEKLIDELNSILEEEVDIASITFTPRGAKKFKEFAAEEGKPGSALRFGDMAGGCSGFQYLLDFSEGKEPDDTIFESEGVQIHVKKAALSRLLGCVIDYVDSLHGGGFKISNPNVKSSCGCGTSQGY